MAEQEEGGIGLRLREERLRLGFSQAQVAEFADVSHRTIVSWERGEVRRIPPYNVRKLNSHGFDTLYILTGERAPSAETREWMAKFYESPVADRLKQISTFIVDRSRETGYELPTVWATLIQELMLLHGLSEKGATRLIETLKHKEQK